MDVCETRYFYTPFTNGSTPDMKFMTPDFTTFNGSTNDTYNMLHSSLSNIRSDVASWSAMNCTDARIEKLGLVQGSKAYNDLCQNLAYDFGQTMMTYQCNNWFCGNKGQCSSVVQNSTVIASCTCNAGFKGTNCLIPEKDYSYGLAWLNGVNTWLKRYPVINSTNVFKNFLDIAADLILFANNVKAENDQVNLAISAVMGRILNANIQVDQLVQSVISTFMGNVMLNSTSNPLPGFDMNKVLTRFFSNYIVGGYGVLTKSWNASGVSISQATSNRRVLNEFTRFLSSSALASDALNRNTAPSVVLPANLTAALPTSTNFSLSFVQDPLAYPQLPAINSFVVSVTAATGSNVYQFPATAAAYRVNVPWAYVPFTVMTGNCTVVDLVNNAWVKSSKCSVDTVDEKQASVMCSEFATIAVSCQGGAVNPMIYAGSTSSSGYVAFSSFVIALVGLLLF